MSGVPVDTFWTDERSDEVSGLWREGISLRTIAAKYGVTQGKISGKLRRLGLFGIEGRPPTVRAKRVTLPGPKPARSTADAKPPAARKPGQALVAVVVPQPAPVAHGPTRLEDLQTRSCRWPLNKWAPGGGAAVMFCGEDAPSEKPHRYCPKHLKQSYAPALGRLASATQQPRAA